MKIARREPRQARIEIIPMIDTVFFLLVFFMMAGLALELRVTDIDLAGEFEPWRGPQFERTRFMREIYAPRIDFEFRLTNGQGRVVGEGQRSLRDPNYLARSSRLTGERLRYEKDLLREWFRGEFAR